MKSTILWGLVGLNALLLGMFLSGMMHDNTAMAQRTSRPSDYIIIPGDISGGAVGVVYIIDASNGMLSAMVYDDSSKKMESMAPVDLSRVFEAEAGGGSGTGTRRHGS